MSTKPKIIKRGTWLPTNRQHIDYAYTVKALKKGDDAFFTGVNRQTIHKAAKKLSKMVGEEIVALPYQNGGEKGYVVTPFKHVKKMVPDVEPPA